MEIKKFKLICFKTFIFGLLFLLNILSSFSYQEEEIYISEINFIDDEYIEIFSKNFLNLSDAFIYDDNGYSRFNTLSLVKYVPESNLNLIIGSRFLNNINNNISNLNCSIYLTSSTQVSNGGLKNNGEEILIEYNSNNSNLSFIPEKDFEFKENSSLHFLKNGSYFISNISPCKLSLPILLNNSNLNQTNLNSSIVINQSGNITNFNNSNLVNSSGEILDSSFSCNINFSILPKENITSQKIEFSFFSNIENSFLIEYWIEDFSGNIVKNKLNTSSKNFKVYTPKSSLPEIYFIKAKLYSNHNYNCSLFNQSMVFFYPEKYSYDNIINTQNLENKPEILILNQDKIINKNSKTIDFNFYRGNYSSKIINIFLNDENLQSLELSKFQNLKGNLFVELNYSIENLIVIEGFGIYKEIYIPKINNILQDNSLQYNGNANSNQNVVYKNSFNKSFSDNELNIIDWINNAPSFYFNISILGFDVEKNRIFFNLTFPNNFDFNSNCKILQGRRVISNLNEDLEFGLNYLNFNEPLTNQSFLNSKINCRIDPMWRVTPIYFDLNLYEYRKNFSKQIFSANLDYNYYGENVSDEFVNDLSLVETLNGYEQNSSGTNIFKLNNIKNESNISDFNFLNNSSQLKFLEETFYQNSQITDKQLNFEENLILQEDINDVKNQFISKQLGFKFNSFLGILIGSLLLVIFIIFFK